MSTSRPTGPGGRRAPSRRPTTGPKRPKRTGWRRWLRVAMWTLAGFFVLGLGALALSYPLLALAVTLICLVAIVLLLRWLIGC